MSNSNVIDFTEVRSEAIAETDISGANISNVDVRVEYMVTEAIKQFRIPAHLRGYTYLREAIMYAVSAPMIWSITKMIYPSIAVKYSTNSSMVERSIRHAIDASWENGGINGQQIIGRGFVRKGRPTNAEFIATIADFLRLTLKVQRLQDLS